MSTTATTQANDGLPASLKRSHVVWGALMASMTTVAGVLTLLQSQAAVPATATPLVQLEPSARASGASLERIFETTSAVKTDAWQGIVIHHSGSAMGSPESIARQHEARGFRGLGYHFVVSNGQGAPDGQVFVGSRWLDQLPGAHTAGPKSEQYNRTHIGICLVGDGERRPFTREQIDALAQVVRTLQDKLGIPEDRVVMHRDVAPTASPGRLFPEAELRARLNRR